MAGVRRWSAPITSRELAEARLDEIISNLESPTMPEAISPWPITGGVYFATDHRQESIKIGHTANFAERLATGACWVPTIRLVATIHEASRQDEADLHARWRSDLIGGEWFRASRALLLFLWETRL